MEQVFSDYILHNLIPEECISNWLNCIIKVLMVVNIIEMMFVAQIGNVSDVVIAKTHLYQHENKIKCYHEYT